MSWGRRRYPPEDDWEECPDHEGRECDCAEAAAEDAAVAKYEDKQDYEEYLAEQGYYDP